MTDGIGGVGFGGDFGDGGMGRTRVGNGDVEIAETVRSIVSRIEAGFWQVVGPEVVREEQVAKSLSIDVRLEMSIDVCVEKCNIIDPTIALHPIDTSATTMTTTDNDKRNNNDTDIETYVVFSPLFPTLTLTTRGRLTATANNCLTNASTRRLRRRPQRQRRHAHTMLVINQQRAAHLSYCHP